MPPPTIMPPAASASSVSRLARAARVALVSPLLSRASPDRAARLGAWMRRELEAAGCVFVKAGQWVSSRGDVFPHALVEQLSGLRASVAPEPPDTIAEAVRAAGLDLGCFDADRPVSCGSVAQVHLARFRGRRVAVKVVRPGVASSVAADARAAHAALAPLRLLDTRVHAEASSTVRQLAASVSRETNLGREARRMRAFEAYYRPRGVVVPRPLAVAGGVLVMTYEPSRPLCAESDAARVTDLMDLFVGQVFDLGLLHADMHAGNVGVGRHGKLVLYDFGAVTRVPRRVAQSLKHAGAHLLGADPADPCVARGLVDILLRHGVLTARELTSEQREALEAFVAAAAAYAHDTDIAGLQRRLEGRRGPDGVDFCPEILAVARTFTLLEGLCKGLDPDGFRIVDSALRAPSAVAVALDPDVWRARAAIDVGRL